LDEEKSCYNCGLRSASRDLPADEDKLVPLATLLFVFKVVNSPPTLGLWESIDEILVIDVCARLLDDDLCMFLVEVIDDVLVLVTKLEILVCGKTARVDGYARGLETRLRMDTVGLQKAGMETHHG
jgi:hypothetical protein